MDSRVHRKDWRITNQEKNISMQEIQWERIANGQYVQLITIHSNIKDGGLALKELAFAKMREVNLISADFQGESMLFALLLGVFFDRVTNAEFLGIYQVNNSTDEGTNTHVLPTFCFKRAIWDKDRDSKQLSQVSDKRSYVEGKEQI